MPCKPCNESTACSHHRQQNAIIVQLANSLQAIIAQKLLPRASGLGRVFACEVCIATHAVRNRIRDHEVHLLYTDIQTGRKYKMQTMDQVLLESVPARRNHL